MREHEVEMKKVRVGTHIYYTKCMYTSTYTQIVSRTDNVVVVTQNNVNQDVLFHIILAVCCNFLNLLLRFLPENQITYTNLEFRI